MTPKKAILITIKAAFIVGIFLVLFGVVKIDFIHDRVPPIKLSDIREVLSELSSAQAFFWLTFAATIKLCGIFCGIFRWKLLLRAQGIRLPLWYLTKCWFMGRAIGLFLPGTVGLDGYRLVESSAYTGEVIKCTTVIAVEKLIGFVALAVLVFLTLPLGMTLFEFNLAVLVPVLFILFCFIATAFLLLLNPRIVQVLVQAVPLPGAVRKKVNELGVAITAYSGHRVTLLFAVLLGLGVHLGIAMMYFGTAMAVTQGTVLMRDVLFASPLVIVLSIIAPTVSGLGVREGGFGFILGEAYGSAEAFATGHLGLWIGEMVPFILSVPLLIFATRPNKEEFLAELETVREETAKNRQALELPHEEVAAYRRKLGAAALAGVLGGLIGGAVAGLAEAGWHIAHLTDFAEASAYWWGPLVYGVVFSGLGLGIAAGLVFFYLLFNRFAPAAATFGLSMGGTLAALILVVGRFRYQRDVLEEHALSMNQNLVFLFAAVLIAVVVAVGAGFAARAIAKGPGRAIAGGLCAFTLVVLLGYGLAALNQPEPKTVVFEPAVAASGPNVILVAVDTLRADYLPFQDMDAPAKTPNLSAFASDSVVFQNTFAQSSWTKASFGTIFSGMYPEAHSATSKVSSLPDDVTTIAESVTAEGYFAKGYSNNPNITSLFNYNQGFTDYVDLKPDLYFGAQPSSEKLVIYDILRKVVQVVNAKFRGGRIVITDFYQPAERVTDTALGWLDGDERPDSAPFMLFLHYMDPHDPFRDPERPGKGYARVQLGNPDPDKYLEAFKRSYIYEIEYADEHIGRFLDGLKERGLYENSLIVFTADHGEEFYEHGGWWHGLSLYDEQIGVPLVVKLPGNAEAGAYVTALTRHVDLAPTVAAIAGAEASTDWQGAALFENVSQSWKIYNTDAAFVHSHLNFEGIELQALRSMERKLIRANEGNKRDYAPVEFYDLQNDPGEQTNLAGDPAYSTGEAVHQKALDEMHAYIVENAKQPMLMDPGSLTEEQRQQLEALGYLGSEEEAPDTGESDDDVDSDE